MAAWTLNMLPQQNESKQNNQSINSTTLYVCMKCLRMNEWIFMQHIFYMSTRRISLHITTTTKKKKMRPKTDRWRTLYYNSRMFQLSISKTESINFKIYSSTKLAFIIGKCLVEDEFMEAFIWFWLHFIAFHLCVDVFLSLLLLFAFVMDAPSCRMQYRKF